MEQYIEMKIVDAEPAIRYKLDGDNTFRYGSTEDMLPSNEHTEYGYRVRYKDGYESWSPVVVFEKAYRRVDGINFGLALEAAKAYKRIARKEWNEKGMFVFLADDIEFRTDADLSNMEGAEGDLVMPSLVMKTADGKFCVGWLASQADMLADDWYILFDGYPYEMRLDGYGVVGTSVEGGE